MLRKKFSIWFFITALLTALWSPIALAHGNNYNGHHKPNHPPGQHTLVAIGDSITFGYGLETNLTQPSRYAFPALIGHKTGLKVQNLSVSGATTADLLAALNSSKSFRNAVSKAGYVTLNIGGADLLAALEGDRQVTPAEAQAVLGNIQIAISKIRELTKAPIVVYNTYNPFPAGSQDYQYANQILVPFNAQIAAIVAQRGDRTIVLADAYSAFLGCQSIYLLPNDVHPNRQGHHKLAEIGLKALKSVKHHKYQHQR